MSCNNNQLAELNSLDREGQLYRNSKQSIEKTSRLIDKTIKDNTTKEVEDVQLAIKKLNEKVEKIMQTNFIKDKQKSIEDSQKQMKESIKKATDVFFKVRGIIISKEGISEEKKQGYIKKLYESIIDKFMTKEERMFFERLVKNNGVIFVNGGMRTNAMNMIGF
tara:strand:- start:46 stop:537 length:492 start_codon:yes stop_codon:yes gene_type:complete